MNGTIKNDIKSFLINGAPYWGVVMFLASVFAASTLLAASPGTTAANFLKIGIGARGSAMGEAQSAVTEDVTANYWNPAGLTRLRFKEVSLMHYQMVESIRYQQASFGVPTESKGTFAFGMSMLDYGDIAGYDVNSLPTGSVEASNLLLTASWARRVLKSQKLSVGGNIKYLSSELAGYKGTATMLDLGASYPLKAGRFRDVRLAAGIRNLGPSIEYDAEGSPLPRQIYVGSGLSALGGNLTLALDYIMSSDAGSFAAFGAEYRVFEILKLRVGYNGTQDFVGNGITYGMGLEFNNWNLDYALVPLGDFGDTNRVSVGIKFGKAQRLQSAEDQIEHSYRRARRLLALGKSVEAYSVLNEILTIAPWHKPSVEMKARIEKDYNQMAISKNRAKMEAEIADKFTRAKEAFELDELVKARQGFESVLLLQPDHVGAEVYIDRIKTRYRGLSQEAFKQGMAYYAAGNYDKAILAFEKTLSIDGEHVDAKAQLAKTRSIMGDAAGRAEEMIMLSEAGDSYKKGLEAYQKNDFDTALAMFEEVQELAPEYEEVGRYLRSTRETLAGILFEESKVDIENGKLDQAVEKLARAVELDPEDTRIQPSLDVARRDLRVKNARVSKEKYQEGLEAYLRGNTDKAERLWKKALELDSSNEDALQAISKLEEQKNSGALNQE